MIIDNLNFQVVAFRNGTIFSESLPSLNMTMISLPSYPLLSPISVTLFAVKTLLHSMGIPINTTAESLVYNGHSITGFPTFLIPNPVTLSRCYYLDRSFHLHFAYIINIQTSNDRIDMYLSATNPSTILGINSWDYDAVSTTNQKVKHDTSAQPLQNPISFTPSSSTPETCKPLFKRNICQQGPPIIHSECHPCLNAVSQEDPTCSQISWSQKCIQRLKFLCASICDSVKPSLTTTITRRTYPIHTRTMQSLRSIPSGSIGYYVKPLENSHQDLDYEVVLLDESDHLQSKWHRVPTSTNEKTELNTEGNNAQVFIKRDEEDIDEMVHSRHQGAFDYIFDMSKKVEENGLPSAVNVFHKTNYFHVSLFFLAECIKMLYVKNKLRM